MDGGMDGWTDGRIVIHGCTNPRRRSSRCPNFVRWLLMFVVPYYETCFMSTLWRLEFRDDSWISENLCTSCTDVAGKRAAFIFFPYINNNLPFCFARELLTSHTQTLHTHWYIRMGGMYSTHRGGKKSVKTLDGISCKETAGWGT
jgi:hypothetical protein